MKLAPAEGDASLELARQLEFNKARLPEAEHAYDHAIRRLSSSGSDLTLPFANFGTFLIRNRRRATEAEHVLRHSAKQAEELGDPQGMAAQSWNSLGTLMA